MASERNDKPAERSGSGLSPWILAVLPAGMLVVLLQRAIWDVDIFWQLKLGEMMLEHGSLIRTEPFAASHLGEPLPALGWLAQIVLATIRLAFGWTGLRLFDAACWLGGFLAIAWACRSRGAAASGVALALALTFYISVPTASIRPQSFAVLCFGILLALLRLELKPWRLTAACVPLFLLWQNLHPSVSMAAVVLAAYAAAGWMRWLGSRQSGPPWEHSVLAALAAASIFATPNGFAALRVSSENASNSVLMRVSEWLPLWSPVNRGGAVMIFVLLAIAVALLVRNPKRFDLRELAAAAALLAMTVFANRFVLFWALTMIPVIARAMRSPARQRTIPAAVAPFLLVATAAIMPFAVPTHFSPSLPLDALRKLRAEGAVGTIFAYVPWGGPAIDTGYPSWRVAYDGRLYRYTRAEWEWYRAIAKGSVRLPEIVDRYRPAAFVLAPGPDRVLIAQLRRDAGWRQLPAGEAAAVFVPAAVPAR